jgi:uncharacterized ion transporter superfamily protein YfcC
MRFVVVVVVAWIFIIFYILHKTKTNPKSLLFWYLEKKKLEPKLFATECVTENKNWVRENVLLFLFLVHKRNLSLTWDASASGNKEKNFCSP